VEVATEAAMGEGILSGGNQWMVLLLLKLGDGLINETKETFRSGEIGGGRADVISRGLWNDGGVSQWVDQQDTGRNRGSVPWVLEDRGEKDGRLGGRTTVNGGDKSGVVIPKGQGGAGLGGRWIIMGPSLGGRPKEVFDSLASGLDVELVYIVKVGPGGNGGSGRGHFRRQSASIRDCSSVRNSLLIGSKTRRRCEVEGD